jgi:2-oxoisovalerate dehydrogenase E1 component
VPEGYYEIDLSEPSVKRRGKDLTIITLGPALYTAIAAADELKSKHGISAEVIDLRTANPLNYDPLVESVRRTGKCSSHPTPWSAATCCTPSPPT